MKFGKLDTTAIRAMSESALSLPPDHDAVQETLERNAQRWPELTVRTGGTMWNIKEWKGSVFPERAPKRTWPGYYGQSFDTIEYNATHYRIYAPEKMREWAEQMPDDFRFCPKMPAIISHYRRFKNCEGPSDDFIQGLLALEFKLGPTFIQLPPQFAPKHAEALQIFLNSWPRELPLAVEFRHPDWFTGGVEAELVWTDMEARQIGAVISDTAGRRDAVHMRLTAPFLLLRFGGNEGHRSDDFRLNQWAERLATWSKTGGLKEVHFLVHQPDSLYTPETCHQIREIAQRHGLHVVRQGHPAQQHIIRKTPEAPDLFTGL
jgi:uncharacterized protein YecE (DUF72 family)